MKIAFPKKDAISVVGKDGKTYQVAHYNLDVVISVGYRVKSTEGVTFRRWATHVLRQYLAEGVALNERPVPLPLIMSRLGAFVQGREAGRKRSGAGCRWRRVTHWALGA